MNRTKLGLLGLCAMVFGPMAFSAPAAQAEVGAKWLVLTSGGVLKEGSTLHASIGLEKESVFVLHSTILTIRVLFLCTEVKAVEAKLLAEGAIGKEAGVVSGSKILFSGCTTDLNGAAAPECTPTDPVDGAGFIVTKAAHAFLELHELAGGAKDDIIKIVPDVGETLATIALPAACPIGTSVPVIGKLALRDCEGKGRMFLIRHLLEEFTPLTQLFTISKTAEHAATLLGSMWVFLIGSGLEGHAGLQWAGDPA